MKAWLLSLAVIGAYLALMRVSDALSALMFLVCSFGLLAPVWVPFGVMYVELSAYRAGRRSE